MALKKFVGVLALALLVADAAAEQSPLVYLNVSIKDTNRIFVRDLHKDEIEVLVEGVPQTIEHIFSEQVPTLYAILIDTGPRMSPAMRHPFYPTILERVQSFILEFLDRRQEQESYMLATYYHDFRWLVEPTNDAVAVEQALRQIASAQHSPIESLHEGSTAGLALEQTILRFRRRGEMRKAILLFGHTVDEKSIEQLPRLKELLANASVDLYVVSFAPHVSSMGFSFEAQQTPFFYRTLVGRTGGELYDYAGYADRFHRQLGDYVARLHTLYTLAFRLQGLEPAEKPRKVEVRLKRPVSHIDYKREIVY